MSPAAVHWRSMTTRTVTPLLLSVRSVPVMPAAVKAASSSSSVGMPWALVARRTAE